MKKSPNVASPEERVKVSNALGAQKRPAQVADQGTSTRISNIDIELLLKFKQRGIQKIKSLEEQLEWNKSDLRSSTNLYQCTMNSSKGLLKNDLKNVMPSQ